MFQGDTFMFNQHHLRHAARHRRRDEGRQAGREMRDELRRNLRHHGPHDPAFSLRELFGGGRRGGMVRRGEIRPLILAALRDKPMHGYEVIQELEAQSGGRWRPSAGSIYPTLQQLSDEGLVTSEDLDGRRVYSLTETGRTAAAATAAPSPWADAESSDADGPDVRKLALQLVAAAMQVQKVGSPRAHLEATRILTDARKQLYRLLADDEDASAEEPSQAGW
jgi:DNA-binding PadR family transcriptional regulator